MCIYVMYVSHVNCVCNVCNVCNVCLYVLYVCMYAHVMGSAFWLTTPVFYDGVFLKRGGAHLLKRLSA